MNQNQFKRECQKEIKVLQALLDNYDGLAYEDLTKEQISELMIEHLNHLSKLISILNKSNLH